MIAELPAEKTGLHFYLPSFAGGGAERIFIRIANHLAAEGRPVCFIVNHDGGPLKGMLSEQVELEILGTRRGPLAVMALAQILRRRQPDILISALTRTNIVALLAARLAGQATRVIVCERNQYSSFVQTFDPVRRWGVGRLVRWLYPTAHAVIGNTRDVALDIAQAARLAPDKTAVIPNPAPDHAELEAARGTPPDHAWFKLGGPVAVAIGRLVPQKDYPTMLEAVAQSGDTLRLAILGTGPEKAAIEAHANHLGIADRVDLLGFRMDRLAYLVHADLFLLSSITEGFPNALIEAVSAGIPAVTTDCAGGGAREIMGTEFPDRIVPVGEASAMAGVIRSILEAEASGPQSAERDRARRIAQRFEIGATADAFLARATA
ncbi:MAG: glycosyltransferase [Pseudomonadota bacterium]